MVFIKLKLWQRLKKLECCIFRQVEICIFNILNSKRLKKEKKARNLQQNLTKKCFFFKFAPKHWSKVLFPEKKRKPVKIDLFQSKIQFFNKEIFYYQHLGCAAPKHWSKYKTLERESEYLTI